MSSGDPTVASDIQPLMVISHSPHQTAASPK